MADTPSKHSIRLALVLEASTGGTRRHVVDVLRALSQREDFHCTLIASNLRDSGFTQDMQQLRQCGVVVHDLPMARAIRPVFDWQAYRALVSLMKTHTYDIVHTHSSKAGVLGRMAAHSAKVPCVVHSAHVFPFEMDGAQVKRRLYLAIERWLAKCTDRCVAIGHHEAEIAQSHHVFAKSKISILHNGIACDQWAASDDLRYALRKRHGISPAEVVIGCIGRLCHQKGVDRSLAAFLAIANNYPHAHLVFVGEGELRQALSNQLVGHEHCASRVHFLDRTDDIAGYYDMVDVVLAPSRWEALPYSLLEAVAKGKSVVATDVGDVPTIARTCGNICEVPNGDHGALVQSLEGAILSLQDDEETIDTRPPWPANYSLEFMISTLSHYYQDMYRDMVVPFTGR